MTTAYELEIKEQCPQAEIVFDLYHVVAKYGREKVLKSSRWLLLRNRHNLKPEQAVHLKELLAANQSLLCVYVLRDELKRLWFYRKPACAEKAWGRREVIDRVRVDQANQLRHDKPARKVLKSSRWLLLRNRHNLKPEQAVHLKELLAANQSLLCVYVLRGAP